MIAFVAASPSIDRTHEIDELRPGSIHRPASHVAVPGGKALNAARAAHALGGEVHAVALLGGHAGRWIAEALAAEGISLDHVPGPGESRMALSVSDGGPLTEFYEPAPEIAGEHWDALEAAVATAAGRARWIAISGSLPPGAPDDAYGRLVAAARATGAQVALDARGKGLAAGLDAGPDFVKVNASEAAELGLADAHALRRAAGRDGTAAITHGTDGIELATAYGQLLRTTPPVLGRFSRRQRRRRARRVPRRARRRRRLGRCARARHRGGRRERGGPRRRPARRRPRVRASPRRARGLTAARPRRRGRTGAARAGRPRASAGRRCARPPARAAVR
jgi:fructose-1-phosphate kinase PfkB-like protein